MVIAGRIQRYIFWENVSGLALTLGIILGAILLVDIVEQMRTVGARIELSLAQAFQLTILKAPQLIQETLPFAILVGSILAYSKLNRSSELSAVRASGVSAWRFLGPAIFLAALLGIVTMTLLDPLSTYANDRFETRRTALMSDTSSAQVERERHRNVWLRQGSDTSQSVIHGTLSAKDSQSLENVEIFIFDREDQEFEFRRRIDAKAATLKPGFWQLSEVKEYLPGQVEPAVLDFLALPSTLDPGTLLNQFSNAKAISFWKLPALIAETNQAGLDDSQYVIKYHTLLATPFMLTAMALIGAVVCLRMHRSGGATQLISIGIASGFGLFFVIQVAKGLAASGMAPPEAAAWCPPLVALFSILSVIAFVEDG